MLRLNLPPSPGSHQRRKVTVAFDSTAQWREAVGLQGPNASKPRDVKNGAGAAGRSGSAGAARQTKTKHTRDILHAINCDADSCDDTTSSDEEPSSDSGDDDEDLHAHQLSAKTGSTLHDRAGASKGDLYFGIPATDRKNQEAQLKGLFREFAAIWGARDRGHRPLDTGESKTVSGPTDLDDHAPLSSATADDLKRIQRHHQSTLDVLEGKRQSRPHAVYPPHIALRFAYCRREEETRTRVYRNLGLARDGSVPDFKFTLVYREMREFYAGEKDMLLERRRLAQRRLVRVEPAGAAAAREMQALRGWEAVSADLSKAVWYQDSINQLKVTQPLHEVFLFLVDEKFPDVVETAICIDGFNRRQLLHVYKAIEDRGFRDVIWVCCDPNDWPRQLTDDASVTIVSCPGSS